MDNNYPLVSILVPIYNSPNISMTLKSILSQTYPLIQLIVLDDGSDNYDYVDIDNLLSHHTGNIYEYYIIHNKRNVGTVKNLNQGLKIATGKYVFNLGGDDVFNDCDVINDWVREFEATSAEIITARRRSFNEDFSIFYLELPIAADVIKITTLEPQDLYEELCKYKNFIFGCCTAYRRDFLNRIGLFDERYRYIEDYPTILRFLRNGGIIHYLNRVVVKHRSGGSSAPITIANRYILEENKIVRCEILPYTHNKKQALISHRNWLWDVKKNRYKKADNYIKKIICGSLCAIEFPDKIIAHIRAKRRC